MKKKILYSLSVLGVLVMFFSLYNMTILLVKMALFEGALIPLELWWKMFMWLFVCFLIVFMDTRK